MSKKRTARSYESELREMIKSRTGADMEMWLLPQVRATAANMVVLDKIQDEILSTKSLVSSVNGSSGQTKYEVSPLLPHYDKCQRTLLMQLGRALIALCLGHGKAFLLFFTTDVLSCVFCAVAMWIARRLDGVLEEQKHYLARVSRGTEDGGTEP